MLFDPRCVAYEGRLHADRCTAEYVGRASHDHDAACFRSSRAVAASARATQRLRYFYFETQIVATASTSDVALESRPVRINTALPASASASTPAREVHAMDMEDVPVRAQERDEAAAPGPGHGAFQSHMMHLWSRMERHHVRWRSDKKKFHHKIAVGFLVDVAEPARVGFHGPRVRGATNTHATLRETLEKLSEVLDPLAPAVATEEAAAARGDHEARKTSAPAIRHEDLGEMVHSVAYVGKSGRVIAHGRACLQCEKYGAGDVVGCGIMWDTKTFFFTLNGKFMGMLAARDVVDLDAFREEDDDDGEDDESEEETSTTSEMERGQERRDDRYEQVETHDVDEDKVLYAAVSLHGPGECIRAVFEPETFQFDLASFEQEIQKERQRALHADDSRRKKERAFRATEEGEGDTDDATMHMLVHEFFLYYGYENTYKAFERVAWPSESEGLSLNGEKSEDRVDIGPDALSVEAMEEETKEERVERDAELRLVAVKAHIMRQSLSLRHEVRQQIRGYRTAQALEVLEKHAATFVTPCRGYSRRVRKLLLSVRILCVMDALVHEEETNVSSRMGNGAHDSTQREERGGKGWHPESALGLARQLFRSLGETTTNGKRKRRDVASIQPWEDNEDVMLAMTLLLYDQMDSIPETSRAKKFLMSNFRDAVADELNLCLVMGEEYMMKEEHVSLLETFIRDLEALQQECLRLGCRVYPEHTDKASNDKCQSTSRQWKVPLSLVSLSSADSSSSPSEPDDNGDDEE
ncbi:hypothetical protein PsorP6_010463 [Peronosclerospora sorghi]|uniref:Uncharacterized protein n=1 Tax=Peronosclerospora sorghi TaxID=230839 RepID=A0ACC0VX34_9STRA|nr:hypothetical protein PsorP6_010463 [Peronosclerospora sorghi]